MSSANTKLERINQVAKLSDNLEYMSPNQMGSFIDVAPATIRGWIRSHKLKPAIEEGNTVLLHRKQAIDCIMLKNKINSNNVESNLFLMPLSTTNKSLIESKKKELFDNLNKVSGIQKMMYIDNFDSFKEKAYKSLVVDDICNLEGISTSLNVMILQNIVTKVREAINSAIISKYRDDSVYIECSYKELRDYLLGVATNEEIQSINDKINDKFNTFKNSLMNRVNEIYAEYGAKTVFENANISLGDIYYSVATKESKADENSKTTMKNEVIQKYKETYAKTLEKLTEYPFDTSTEAYQNLVKSNVQAFLVTEISKKFYRLKEEGFYSIEVFNSADTNQDIEETIYSGVYNNVWLLNDSEMPENISQAIKLAEKMNNIKIHYQSV